MLKFIHGCMGCGKTAQMINAYEIMKRKELHPLVLKPAVDDREGKIHGWGMTRSRLMPDHPVKAFYYTNLEEDIKNLDYGVIIIDEAQFMSREDVEFISSIVDNKNINVLAYGLKTSVTGELFEGSAALLALADEVKEMESLCSTPNCNNRAQLHARFINGKFDRSNNPVVIEKGNVTYKPVCRPCWNKMRKER